MQALLFLCATIVGNKFTVILTATDLVMLGESSQSTIMLDRSGLLPSIVLMQAAFQKDEGYSIFLYLCSSSTSLDPALSN